MTHHSTPFVWGAEHNRACVKIKSLMANAETLAHFDPKLETSVVADASPCGLGAVLLQNNRVVAYGHRSLSDIERKYSQTEREALG